MKLVSTSDERLPGLSREARRRRLDVEHLGDGCFTVSSYSNPGWRYSVQVMGEDAKCSCIARSACTHIAACLYESSFDFYRQCRDLESDAFFALSVRLRTGKASRSERKKYKAAGLEVLRRIEERKVVRV